MAIELLTPFTKVELEPEIKDKKRKQVGILGGNFNPVHNAHLVVADQVRQQLGLDKVLLMPEYEPPHVDKKETIDEGHRLKMLELAIDGIEGLEIETIELERKGISYTYDTMKLLNERDPDTDYYFIIGADSLFYFDEWKNPERICAAAKILVATRDQAKEKELLACMERNAKKLHGTFLKLDTPNLDVSSHELREWIREGKSVKYYLPDSVISYIQEQKIYQD